MKHLVLAIVTAAELFYPTIGFAADGDVIDPTTLRDTIRISLGQEFDVAFEDRGDRLADPHRVIGSQAHPLVALKLFVPPDHKDLLVLIVKSSYPRTVRYRAAARLRGDHRFIETNMAAVYPNLPVFESWRNPFEELVLFDFHFTEEKLPERPNQALQPTATVPLPRVTP